MRQILQTHWPGILILLIALIIGFDTYQDFGISIDEVSQREIGLAAYNYTIGEFDGFTEYQFRDHGPGMEWIYVFFERQLNLSSFRDIFLMRHIVTYLFFVLCGFALYVWIYRVFRNRWLAAFGLAALLFHPVLFGHAFFNPKDIPAMSIFLVSMAVAQWAFARQKLWPFFIFGLVCGYSATIRLMNIIVLVPVALFFLIDIFQAARQRGNIARIILAGTLVIAGTCVTLYACWPALWEHPIAGLQYAYETSAQYPWKGQMQFAGNYIHSTNLPWSYIPTWMFITTPELFVLPGLIGIAIIVVRLVSKPGQFYRNTPNRSILLAFICFFLPLILIIRLDVVLYDGW
ncbi:MAG: hypothetical protein K8F30_06535, partial [Taibaiella sp.]|nr:hypothetical protein [Taibaiella sp.]